MSPALHISELPRCVSGWLASEKLDGVRGLWDGSDFLSRSGRVLNVPQWFREGMPRVKLDGELWTGRGQFQRVRSIVQSKRLSWEAVMFRPFEVIDMRQPIEARIAALSALDLPAWVSPWSTARCAHTRTSTAWSGELSSREAKAWCFVVPAPYTVPAVPVTWCG